MYRILHYKWILRYNVGRIRICDADALQFVLCSTIEGRYGMNEQLIDINDLADQLKVPPKTIRNKLSNGSWPIEPLRIGKALRWRQSDVNLFIGGGTTADNKIIPMESQN